MSDIIKQIRKRASEKNMRVILPETEDIRVLEAGVFLQNEQICEVGFIGNISSIKTELIENGLALPDSITVYDPDKIDFKEQLVDYLYERRKHKGIKRKEAADMLANPLYLAGALVGLDRADACVAGSVATTGEVIRAAIHTLGLRKGTNIVSSTFLMALKNGKVLTYADCGVVPYPDSEQLADIAIESARTHKLLTQDEPRIAMLSFSSKGSARHERTQLVTDALKIVQNRRSDLIIDGELQFDAAYDPDVAKRKAPDSRVAGNANVFVFPNLDAGNIAYKITERLAGATATGPILQGLAKPMMDLSRGCNWEDIVNAAAVAILMGEEE